MSVVEEFWPGTPVLVVHTVPMATTRRLISH